MPRKFEGGWGCRPATRRSPARYAGAGRGTMIAEHGRVKTIALLAGCLMFLACSSDGNNAGTGKGGQGGGQAGSTGGGGRGGTTGGGGQTGGSSGGGGQAAGS